MQMSWVVVYMTYTFSLLLVVLLGIDLVKPAMKSVEYARAQRGHPRAAVGQSATEGEQ